jgi:hypothetical protein
MAVTDPPHWNETSLRQLRDKLTRAGDTTGIAPGWFRS